MKSRVLFVCPTSDLDSGGEKSNFELIKYLKNKGYELSVITASEGEYSQVLSRHDIYNKPGGYKWWAPWDNADETAEKSIKGLRVILETIKERKPDVVVTNTLNIPWGAMASAMMNKPHMWISREFPEREFDYLDEKMEFIDKFSNRVIANSEGLAERINQKYNLDFKYFYSYVDDNGLELSNYNGNPRVISINGITKRKNQSELIEAMAILKEEGFPLAEVLLIGHAEEEYKTYIEELIDRYNLGGTIRLIPFNPKPWSLVGSGDILVQTSLSESIGRSTTEAMKLGVPVIASDIPGHREAFKLGGGTLYKSGSALDLARKIKAALNDTDKLLKEALLTKNRVLKNMSESACNDPFIREMEKIVGKSNPMHEMVQIEPYLSHYLDLSVMWYEKSLQLTDLLNKKKDEILNLQNQINTIKHENNKILNSGAYRIGLCQSKILRAMKPKIKRRAKHE